MIFSDLAGPNYSKSRNWDLWFFFAIPSIFGPYFWSQKEVSVIDYFGNIVISDLSSIFAWSQRGRYNRNRVYNLYVFIMVFINLFSLFPTQASRLHSLIIISILRRMWRFNTCNYSIRTTHGTEIAFVIQWFKWAAFTPLILSCNVRHGGGGVAHGHTKVSNNRFRWGGSTHPPTY